MTIQDYIKQVKSILRARLYDMPLHPSDTYLEQYYELCDECSRLGFSPVYTISGGRIKGWQEIPR